MVEVRVGQKWQDMDGRPPRTLRVIEVTDTHARVQVIAHPHIRVIGRRTWIRLDRMVPGSRGYRLIEQGPSNAVGPEETK